MRYYTDLHIHTALSPCASNDMTPHNIVNMALLKGLDFIAVTDHNSMLNVKSVMEVGKKRGLMVVPGIEVCTKEDIHVVCLFEELSVLEAFSKKISQSMPVFKNRPDIYSEQRIINQQDEVVDVYDNFLLLGCGYSIDDLNEMVIALDGVFIPAHIYRQSSGVIGILGEMPPTLKINYVEAGLWKEKEKYTYIRNSDAHSLEQILERVQSFELQEKTIKALLNKLKYVKKV